jgi:alkanesulfonate monooxygenase SsuD/methylene tetrahydromethanopterin reductase-like flavin-dependent oxidoreductase (luciferase family)
MRWGAHLPLVDFGDGGARLGELCDVVCAARELGFDTVSANDHLLWRRPWLDGLTALSAVVEHATGMTMATSVALPAVRHPVVLAKSVATLAVLHNGPFIAGIGPGSGPRGLRGGGCAVRGAMEAIRRGGADPASGAARREPARCQP